MKENQDQDQKEKTPVVVKEKKSVLLPILVVTIFLFLVLLCAVVWVAAKKPMVVKQIIETNISSVVKEVLPASEYVCLVYNYQSITQRAYNPGNWLNARNLLFVLDGTIKLGFDCGDIDVREHGSQIMLIMPPVKILAHEQHTDRARSYELAGGGVLPRAVRPQEVLDLLGDTKIEKEEQVEANEALIRQARESAEALFKPLLELIPSIRGNYTLVFLW